MYIYIGLHRDTYTQQILTSYKVVSTSNCMCMCMFHRFFVSAAHLKFRKEVTAAVLLASTVLSFQSRVSFLQMRIQNYTIVLYGYTCALYTESIRVLFCTRYIQLNVPVMFDGMLISVVAPSMIHDVYEKVQNSACMYLYIEYIHTLHHMCTCINIQYIVYINTSSTPYILLRPFIAYICAVATCSAPHLQEGEANGHAPSGDCMFSKVHSLHVQVVKSSYPLVN